MIDRRAILRAALAMPAVVAVGSIMPISARHLINTRQGLLYVYVDENGKGQFTTIQAAVDFVNRFRLETGGGVAIHVRDGLYEWPTVLRIL